MMNNEQHESKGLTPVEGKWQVDHFFVRMMHADFVDALPDVIDDDETAMDVLDYLRNKQHYKVDYKMEVFFSEGTLSFQLSVNVNHGPEEVGYRISCAIQTDYVLTADPEANITQDSITPEDMEYFLMDSHLSLQDHIVVLTETMLLGAYILPPPDLDGAIGRELEGLI